MTLCRYSGSFSYIPQKSVGRTETLNSVSVTVGAAKFYILFFLSAGWVPVGLTRVVQGTARDLDRICKQNIGLPQPGLIPF